jgi:hypothetical protein
VSGEADFDLQAAWLRRFTADAESNLRAFAMRLKEALPDRVTVHEKSSLFSGKSKVTGIELDLGENRYVLTLAGSRLQASVALVVRGIALNTRSIDPAEWFARLADETKRASAQAKALSQSLSAFMGG